MLSVCLHVSPQYANLHMFSICIHVVVVFVSVYIHAHVCTCICAMHFELPLYSPYKVSTPSKRFLIWGRRVWMQRVWWSPPFFPFFMSVFKQKEGSDGAKLSWATSKMSKSDSTPYLDRHGLTGMWTLTDTHTLMFSHIFKPDLK